MYNLQKYASVTGHWKELMRYSRLMVAATIYMMKDFHNHLPTVKPAQYRRNCRHLDGAHFHQALPSPVIVIVCFYGVVFSFVYV